MAMRLQELHPSLVHAPITLFPLTIGADTLGRITKSPTLLKMGRWGIGLTTASAAAAGVAGLVAQEEVNVEGRALDMLITHRTLNLGFLSLAAAMTVRRVTKSRPSWRYLAAGLAGIGTLFYSAYLGGHMVYEHGVGVNAAGGIRDGHAPELRPGRMREAAEHAGEELEPALRHTVEELAQGKIVPSLTGDGQVGGGA